MNGRGRLVSGPENGDGGADADGCFRAARQNFQALAVWNIKNVVRPHGDILSFLFFDLRDVHRDQIFLPGDWIVAHDYRTVGFGKAGQTVGQRHRFQRGDLLSMALQNVAAGLRDARAGDIDDAGTRHRNYVAAVDHNVVSRIAGLQQILQANGDDLRIFSERIVRRRRARTPITVRVDASATVR